MPTRYTGPEILYTAVEHTDKKVSGFSGDVTLFLKDFTILKFKIQGQEDTLNVAASVEALSSLESARSYYPFFLNLEILDDGWELFRMQEEYNKVIGASTDWRISSVNQDFKVCRSYPNLVIVPTISTDEMLKTSAGFRQYGRFPVLAYLHSNNVPILRSSQPLTGSGGRRCKEDEKLLGLVATGHKGTIVDTRSNSSINASKSKKGGGIETDYYTHWRRTTHSIEKMTHLPDTIARLYDACADLKSQSWLLKLEGSGWMKYIETCMTAAYKTAVFVSKDRSPVLVHGEQGTDMTLLVTSLAQVLLNPKCRTVIGFESLVMREWVWAGYPFTKRHLRVGISPNRKKENASTFLLFLDCVHQVMHQYSSTFEFNEQFLLTLFEHSYYSRFGTFLFDCEMQREQSKVRNSTTSLWSYLNDELILVEYRNPLYELNKAILWPSVAPQSFTLWRSMFGKATLARGPDSKKEIIKVISDIKKENQDLKSKANSLKQKYEELLRAQQSQLTTTTTHTQKET